nr:BofC C-terminal domain-containing protein [Anaerocolumna aminovalerica]
MNDLTFDEFKNGLTSFELLTFSEKKVTLRKTYNKDLVENQFFLKSQNGKIVVYYGDQKTVYEYTEVTVEHLTQYEQLKLEEGIFVKDEEELYSILENYSS